MALGVEIEPVKGVALVVSRCEIHGRSDPATIDRKAAATPAIAAWRVAAVAPAARAETKKRLSGALAARSVGDCCNGEGGDERRE
jgi:hypothetical protein